MNTSIVLERGNRSLWFALQAGALCMFTLSCGGSGGASPSTASKLGSKLFVYDSTHGAVASFTSMFPTGNTAADRTIIGNQTRGDFAKGMAYDSVRDRLYLSVDNPFSGDKGIMIFANASQADGNVAPSTYVPMASKGLFLDSNTDQLYVGTSQGVDVFPQASQLSRSSTPRHIVCGGPSFFTVDTARKILYAKCYDSTVNVYDNVDALSGTVTASRTFSVPAVFDSGGMALDMVRDRLYTTDTWGGVYVVPSASTVMGTQHPLTLRLTNPTHVAYDPSQDRIYVSCYDKVYVVSNASQVTANTSASVWSAPNSSIKEISF